jgi:hypothetical protein
VIAAAKANILVAHQKQKEQYDRMHCKTRYCMLYEGMLLREDQSILEIIV